MFRFNNGDRSAERKEVMSKNKIIKYQLDGKKVEVIKKDGEQYLVAPFYEYEGEELVEDINFYWEFRRNLFDKPDQVKKIINQEIVKLQSQVEALKKQKEEIGREIIETSKIIERLGNKNKVLRQLEDFISGNVKWIIIDGWRTSLDNIEKLKYEDKIRLISLYGHSNGDIGWRINSYNDGSGGEYDCFLFTDYEMARTELKKILLNKNINEYDIKEAQKHNIELPAEKIEQFKKEQRKQIEHNIKEGEKSLSALKAKLSTI